MNTLATELQEESLTGVIEKIIFYSESSGFCVLRAQFKGQRHSVTVVGQAVNIHEGETIEAQGQWFQDKKYGFQFKANILKVLPPTTLVGIEKYLSSGMVKGIGPHFAKKLVAAFGESVFDVIEKEPERLMKLRGIGKKRKAQVLEAWAEQNAVRDIMVFLQSHGVGSARAVRIYKTYGDKAIEKVRDNPYRLSLDVRGIGFKTADDIAEKLGIDKNSMLRAQAGLRHVVQELCQSGHCAIFNQNLLKAAEKLLTIEEEIICKALHHELEEKNLIQDSIDGESCIYPAYLYQAEVNAAVCLQKLNQGVPPWGEINQERVLAWVEEKTSLSLSASQKQAIQTVLGAKLSIITGGPGVGKTTLVNSLLKIIRTKGLRVSLCAPTGRAAKRLSETTGLKAKTIHRLLSFDPNSYGFKHGEGHPLELDVLIIDEASMLDLMLLNHLVKAIPLQAAVIFVGDIDQLPSVGSGAVLADLIKSGLISTVRLTEIFRQAASSKIVMNAHRVREGQGFLSNEASQGDFFALYAEEPEALQNQLLDLVCRRLPQFYNCNPLQDIQILTPMHKGSLGTVALNIALQQQLNQGSEPKMTRFGMSFAPGDKVIQLTNNYHKEVFNGDIGLVESVDLEEGFLNIRFEQHLKRYETSDLDELSLAYAISIHKSQGSEFPIVVMVLANQHYTLLARNLLYTGITRGKKLVVLLGQKKAVDIAISNNKEALRVTKLAQRLRETF